MKCNMRRVTIVEGSKLTSLASSRSIEIKSDRMELPNFFREI